MKKAVTFAAAIFTAALAACSSRPEAPERELEAARVPETITAENAPAVKPSDARNFRLGQFAATALHDGDVSLPNDTKVFGVGHTPAEVAAVLGSAGLPTDKIELSIQPLLIRTADRVMLFDAGAGDNFGPGAGRLVRSMLETGFAPVAVTDIFISHSHGDHVGGLVNASGQLNFPNAAIHMSAPEWAYLKSMTAETAQAQAGISRYDALIAAIAPKVVTFEPDAEVVPRVVKAIAVKGHTPGHSAYLITARKVSLLYIGDVAHHYVVSLRKPEWLNGFDGDPQAAQASRTRLLAEIARTGQLIYAVHFPFPGLGTIKRQDDGYAWVAN